MKAKKYLLIIFVVMFLLDFGTTMYSFHVEGHTYKEANVLFVLTGSMLPVFAANLLIIFIIWKYYGKLNSPFLNYFLITVVLYTFFARIPAIFNAIHSIQNPTPVEIASQITIKTKVTFYVVYELINIYLPLILSCLIYLFFKMDYNITPKNG